MEKAEHTKIKNTRKKLVNALAALTEDRPVEDVTVAELCREAGVNRTTFYKYYSIPEDVWKESMLAHMDEIIDVLNSEHSMDLTWIMRYVCRKLQEDLTATRQIFPHFTLPLENLKEFYQRLRMPELIPDIYLLDFIAGGSAMVIKHWFDEAPDTPSDEIADRLTAYIRHVTGFPLPIPGNPPQV